VKSGRKRQAKNERRRLKGGTPPSPEENREALARWREAHQGDGETRRQITGYRPTICRGPICQATSWLPNGTDGGPGFYENDARANGWSNYCKKCERTLAKARYERRKNENTHNS
jgi:hypothetical protein